MTPFLSKLQTIPDTCYTIHAWCILSTSMACMQKQKNKQFWCKSLVRSSYNQQIANRFFKMNNWRNNFAKTSNSRAWRSDEAKQLKSLCLASNFIKDKGNWQKHQIREFIFVFITILIYYCCIVHLSISPPSRLDLVNNVWTEMQCVPIDSPAWLRILLAHSFGVLPLLVSVASAVFVTSRYLKSSLAKTKGKKKKKS